MFTKVISEKINKKVKKTTYLVGGKVKGLKNRPFFPSQRGTAEIA